MNVLQAQIELNKRIVPDLYEQIKDPVKLDEWVFKFCLAAHQEVAEAIDSLHWKWWKDADDNLDNLKIELVDIYHFILSIWSIYEFTKYYNFNEITKEYFDSINYKSEGILHYLMCLSLSFTSFIHQKNDTDTFKLLIAIFSQCCHQINLSLDELESLYFKKNKLNHHRQDNGYMDGTYAKVVDGVEDNVRLINE